MKKTISTVVVIVLIVGAIWYLESRKIEVPSGSAENQDIVIKSMDERIAKKSAQFEPAKEISTPDGFINTSTLQSGQTAPITIGGLIGKKVILVDFWTYSCINCQRTTPYLNSWYEKYADQGLEILGIHTPEFDFEKDYDNVARAVEKFGIKYPVILDNDYSTWRAYKNQYWPRKYLIDIDGFIVYDHIGEGGYDETEAKIVELLNERSAVLGESAVSVDESAPKNVDVVDFGKVQSPEMYLGYARAQYVGNEIASACLDASCDYNAPETIDFNAFYFNGLWAVRSEYAELMGKEGGIVLRFSASKVNLVAGTGGEIVEAEIYLDGKKVDTLNKGSDVGTDGIVRFGEHGLYNLIDLKGDYGQHILLIKIVTPRFRGFAFTFG